jgi:membrane-associated protease RseP (regulator of RpoE activity)
MIVLNRKNLNVNKPATHFRNLIPALVFISFLFVHVPAWAGVNLQSKKPITQKGLMDALRIGGLTTAEIVREVERYGVDFDLTKQIEFELVSVGAKPEVIKAVRQNYRPGTISGGRSDPPSRGPGFTLGLTIQDVTPTIASSMGLDNTQGALVGGVQKDGPASKAGVRPSDVITGLNNLPVRDTTSLRQQFSRLAPGQEVSLTILREGRELKVVVRKMS